MAAIKGMVVLLGGLAVLGVLASLGYLYIRRAGGYRGF